MTIADIVLVIAATATALMAGLFFAWSCSINLGLARLPDAEYLSAMQQTNRAIQNPVFFAAFFGAPLFLSISVFLHYGHSPRFWLLLTATVVYFTGTFGLTIFGNVPLNNALDNFALESATESEIVVQRANFARRWNNLNHIRTVSSAIAVIIVVFACLNRR